MCQTAVWPFSDLSDDALTRVKILYCHSCGYLHRAEELRDTILEAFPSGVEVTLEVTRAGAFEIATEAFEVIVGRTLVHSKYDGMGFVDDEAKLKNVMDYVQQYVAEAAENGQ